MIKKITVSLEQEKGILLQKDSVVLKDEDVLEITFVPKDPDLILSKWFYSIVRSNGTTVTHELENLVLSITKDVLLEEILQLKVIMKNEKQIYPTLYIVEPIRVNHVFVIGKTLDEIYPEKITSIDDEIKNLKLALVSLSQRIKDLEAETDIL